VLDHVRDSQPPDRQGDTHVPDRRILRQHLYPRLHGFVPDFLVPCAAQSTLVAQGGCAARLLHRQRSDVRVAHNESFDARLLHICIKRYGHGGRTRPDSRCLQSRGGLLHVQCGQADREAAGDGSHAPQPQRLLVQATEPAGAPVLPGASPSALTVHWPMLMCAPVSTSHCRLAPRQRHERACRHDPGWRSRAGRPPCLPSPARP